MGNEQSVSADGERGRAEKDGSDPMATFAAFGLVHLPDGQEREDDDDANIEHQDWQHHMNYDADINLVAEGLYIGGMEGAIDFIGLKQRGITHVLNAGNYETYPQAYRPNDFQYLVLNVRNSTEEKLAQHFGRSTAFIREGRRIGGVFVHCLAGMSRAPALMAAYLMTDANIDLGSALTRLDQIRPGIKPNKGFLTELETLNGAPVEWPLEGTRGDPLDLSALSAKKEELLKQPPREVVRLVGPEWKESDYWARSSPSAPSCGSALNSTHLLVILQHVILNPQLLTLCRGDPDVEYFKRPNDNEKLQDWGDSDYWSRGSEALSPPAPEPVETPATSHQIEIV